jgi:hypothetical protein
MERRFWLALCLVAATGCGLLGDGDDTTSIDLPLVFCGGEDLAWQYVVLLHVKDSVTGANVPFPTFTIDGQAAYGRCLDEYNSDIGDDCDGWALDSGGVITVSADGYHDVMLSANIKGPPGPCGPTLQQVERVVKMPPR